MEFKKITTRYDEQQDRLAIDGQTADGEVMTLWLTHRLLQRLMPPLFAIITPAPGEDYNESTRAAWELTTARARLEPQESVVRTLAPNAPGVTTPSVDAMHSSSWLVQSIDLRRFPAQTLLVFHGATAEKEATFLFSAERLRQWLLIVHSQWRRAGWSLAIWPDWVKEIGEDSGQGSEVLVH
jgi:hypothetical protein